MPSSARKKKNHTRRRGSRVAERRVYLQFFVAPVQRYVKNSLFPIVHDEPCFFFFLMIRLRPRSTLFPYTTLFRSTEYRLTSAELGDNRLQVAPGGCQSVFRRSEEHTSELQSHSELVCRLLLQK